MCNDCLKGALSSRFAGDLVAGAFQGLHCDSVAELSEVSG